MNVEFKENKIEWSKIKSWKNDIKKKEKWRGEIGDSKSGIYIYLAHKAINYPFDNSRIFYIGSARKLAHRLSWHFRRDTDKRLLEDRKTSRWFYQNYYLKKIPFDIIWINCKNEKEIERLFIGLFSAKFGAPPICNARVERNKLKETYKKYQKKNPKIIKKIKKIINRF